MIKKNKYFNIFFTFVYRSIRSFTATLGPGGGKRGYAGITGRYQVKSY